MFFFKAILVVSFFLLGSSLLAQNGASIRSSVDKNKILIGEPLVLLVETKLPAGSSLLFRKIDSIPHFEIVGEPDIDTLSTGEMTTIVGIYKLTSFDSGHWVIPSFSLSGSVQTDTIPVDVVFSAFDPAQEYHDIKDIIEVEPKKKTPWWWYVAGGALLLGSILVYLLRKKKPVTVQPKPTMNAFEEAMKQLEQLKKEKPAFKQFHTRLGEIFRLYIFRKKGILSLQKTTDDLVVQLKDLDIEKIQYDKLVQSLRLGDFVKFAKYSPTSEDDSSCFNEISQTINNIEKTEYKASL
jgi:LPXTG-motif cell wall-anchored protein